MGIDKNNWIKRFNPRLMILLLSAVFLIVPLELLAHGANNCWNTESESLNTESEFLVFHNAKKDVINQKKKELEYHQVECVDWNALKDQEKTWRQQEFAKKPKKEKGFKAIPKVNQQITPDFPAPLTSAARQTSTKSLRPVRLS